MVNPTTAHRSTRSDLSRALGTHILAGLAIASLVVGFVIAFGQVKASSSAPSTGPETIGSTAWMKRPCRQEDSVNCYWDAGQMGNHRGHSFYVRQFPGNAKMVCVMYVKARDARRWDYCESTR